MIAFVAGFLHLLVPFFLNPFEREGNRPRPRIDLRILHRRLVMQRVGVHKRQTKRMSGGWQASGTYLLSGLWDAYARPYSGLTQVRFPVAPDLGGEYSLAQNDQRHRVVLNGIFQLKYGFQASGLYFYGSRSRVATSYGTDLRDLGGIGANRLRPNGTIVPRNNFVGLPLHRVDVRVQRKFMVHKRTSIEGIAEVFNLFNHANYGSYTTQEVSPLYGKPSSNPAVAFHPRMAQLGFRVTF